jgi:hypothetical protein
VSLEAAEDKRLGPVDTWPDETKAWLLRNEIDDLATYVIEQVLPRTGLRAESRGRFARIIRRRFSGGHRGLSDCFSELGENKNTLKACFRRGCEALQELYEDDGPPRDERLGRFLELLDQLRSPEEARADAVGADADPDEAISPALSRGVAAGLPIPRPGMDRSSGSEHGDGRFP